MRENGARVVAQEETCSACFHWKAAWESSQVDREDKGWGQAGGALARDLAGFISISQQPGPVHHAMRKARLVMLPRWEGHGFGFYMFLQNGWAPITAL